MCEQLSTRALQDAQSEQWRVLAVGAEASPQPVVDFLEAKLTPVTKKEAEHYNENGPLGDAIQEAVAVADIVNEWPRKLGVLAERLGGTVTDLVEKKEPVKLGKGVVRFTRLDAQSVMSKQCSKFDQCAAAAAQVLSLDEAHALCALVWVRSQIEIDLDGTKLGAEGLAAMGRSLRSSLVAINLQTSNLANGGGDLSGIRIFCSAIGDQSCCGLTSLDLSDNNLGSGGAIELTKALGTNCTITSLRCGMLPVC